MDNKQFPFQESLTFAWNTFLAHPWTLIGCSLIAAVAYFVTTMIVASLAAFLVAGLVGGTFLTGSTLPFILIGIVASGILLITPSMVSIGIMRGFFRVAFDFYHHKQSSASRIFSELTVKKAFSFFVLFMLYASIITFGFLLIVIPAFIFASRFYYAPFILVDRQKGIVSAFKTSWNITRGYTWINMVFVAVVVCIMAIPVVGLAACLLASVYAYEQLKKQDMPHLYVQQ